MEHNMQNSNYAILLAGGQGSRFWPQSRALEPKQFLSLHNDKSLFEQTILRIRRLIPSANIFIATSELYRNQIIELVNPFKIPLDNLIFEPDGKNTAPSIAVTVALINQRDSKAKIAVLPCDHLIKNSQRFLQILKKALMLCEKNLVIFGIPPCRPATGYGYIQVIKPSGNKISGSAFQVKRFTEKPDLKTALKFIKSGDYYWNSGIFVGSCKVFLREFGTNLPDLFGKLKKLHKPDDISIIWKQIQPVSFDYGILEKSKDLLMLSASGLGWSDLGSWQAWDEILQKDKNGNIFKADVVNLNSKNISVVGANRLIATIGLDDLIIVDTPDAILITKKDNTEDVKKIVDILKSKKRQEQYAHKTVKRPWGSYTVLELGEGFKVKLVEVKPKHSLSLQYHKKRSEHWVVVEGKAEITRGRKSCIYSANESTYIPIGCVHRLGNPSAAVSLKIVEVQAGRYLEEDDIVRLKDDFGRR
jgi:mannose-1-phosphate guanylyltransferase / mannose-6-phosphate isomerase